MAAAMGGDKRQRAIRVPVPEADPGPAPRGNVRAPQHKDEGRVNHRQTRPEHPRPVPKARGTNQNLEIYLDRDQLKIHRVSYAFPVCTETATRRHHCIRKIAKTLVAQRREELMQHSAFAPPDRPAPVPPVARSAGPGPCWSPAVAPGLGGTRNRAGHAGRRGFVPGDHRLGPIARP